MKLNNNIPMAIIASLLTFGCASDIDKTTGDIPDPYEKTNRAIFDFNQTVDKNVIKPVAKGYRSITNEYVRGKTRNFIDNLKEPITFANQILQGKILDSGETLSRFVINSTVGLAGFNDYAKDINLERTKEDFGQTLASWGISSGPYIMLPFFGPSTPRHAVGRVADTFSDPLFIATQGKYDEEMQTPYFAIKTIDTISYRESMIETLDDLESTSVDYYTALRSAYGQSRNEAICDGQDSPNYDFDFDIEE